MADNLKAEDGEHMIKEISKSQEGSELSTDELKAKPLTAKSADEAAGLVKAEGQEITVEETAILWDEI
ncbi:MAG: hypothetical protein IKG30_08785 [Clostridiales bacterium]|nr:hypothetical protein [Clostridiales bacterium]